MNESIAKACLPMSSRIVPKQENVLTAGVLRIDIRIFVNNGQLYLKKFKT